MNERKVLIYLLALVLLIFGFQMYRIFVIQPLNQWDLRIQQSRQLLVRLEDKKNLSNDSDRAIEEEIERILQSFPLETDSYTFSQKVKSSALENGLKLHQFQQGEDQKGPWMEFSLEGSAWAFFHFLDSLYQQGPLFSILRLNIQDREGLLRINLRLAPFSCPEEFLTYRESLQGEPIYQAPERIYSPPELRSLFPYPPRTVPAPAPQESMVTESPSIEEPRDVIDRQSLQYLGRINTLEHGEQFYFKDLRTGQILQLQPGIPTEEWLLKEPARTPFQLSYKDQNYEVIQ